MTTTFTYENEVRQILVDVFEAMLQIPITALPGSHEPVDADIQATVAFEGAWNGYLVLECSLPQAIDWTVRLMSIEPPATCNSDVLDAMGELANMVGGNIKATLPPKNQLSVPVVSLKGDEKRLDKQDHIVNAYVVFESSLGVFAATLFEKVDQ